MRRLCIIPSGGSRKIAIFMLSVGLITLLSAVSILRNNAVIHVPFSAHQERQVQGQFQGGEGTRDQCQGNGTLSISDTNQIISLVNRQFNELVKRFGIGHHTVVVNETVKSIQNDQVVGMRDANEPQPVIDTGSKCMDPKAAEFKRAEDLFCKVLPDFVDEYKNPCFYDVQFEAKLTLKCLPYFYILGMDKCATTDLHSRIATHPDVRGNTGSHNKETKYWSWFRYGVFNYGKINHKWTLEEFFKSFKATALEIQENTNNSRKIITGDATPMDLWDFRFWRQIPQNRGKLEPEILTPHLVKYIHGARTPKFLIQLREPVERLYSDYFFLNHGTSPHSFHQHVTKALNMFQDCRAKHSERYCLFDQYLYQKMQTRLHLGCYSAYIKEWFNVFPRSAFHFTRTEDFRDDMKTTLAGIYSFLDLEPMGVDKLATVVSQNHKHVTTSKRGTMLPSTFRLLKEFYEPYVKETAALLKDDSYLWLDAYEKRKTQAVGATTSRYIPV